MGETSATRYLKTRPHAILSWELARKSGRASSLNTHAIQEAVEV